MKREGKNTKKFYKRWWFWAIIIVLIIGWTFSIGDNGSSTADKSSVTNMEHGSKINRVSAVNFSDSSAGQTTKINKAYIKDISDLGAVDDDMKDIKYALVIHLSIANNATEDLSTYPEQGHIVLPNGTQIKGTSSDSNLTNVWDSLDDISSGAKKTGNVYFPITKKQAKSIKVANFKFQVICGDENLTTKNYDVKLEF